MLKNLSCLVALASACSVNAGVMVPRSMVCQIESQIFSKLSFKKAVVTPYLIEAYVDLVTPVVQPESSEVTHALVFEFHHSNKDLLAKALITAQFSEKESVGGKVELIADNAGKKLTLQFDFGKRDSEKNFPGTLSEEGSYEKLPYLCHLVP